MRKFREIVASKNGNASTKNVSENFFEKNREIVALETRAQTKSSF